MKKILALLMILSLLSALSACDLFQKDPGGDATTTAAGQTQPGDPENPDKSVNPAPMEPLQGGPMLYTFLGSKPYAHEVSLMDGDEYPLYPTGLIDQNGKLVSPPVYHRTNYIYDEDGQRITGLAARINGEITIYALDGSSRVLPCEGYSIQIHPGGRWATIETVKVDAELGNGHISSRPGIFDLEKNEFAIAPKESQQVVYKTGGVVFCYQEYKGEETAQWAYDCNTGKTTEFPLSMGRVQDYYPETGWYGAMWTQGEWERRVYDKNFQRVSALTDWNVDAAGFAGGQWCMIYNNDDRPGVTTWVNREGELSDKQYTRMGLRTDGACYLMRDALLDADLNEVFRLGPGERLGYLSIMKDLRGGTWEGLLLIGADGQAKAAYDTAAKPMQAPANLRFWHCEDIQTLCAAKNGSWVAFDLAQFLPKPKQGDEGGERYARPLAVSEDYIVLETGVHWYEYGSSYDTFAIDWQGNKLDDCPLAPFFDELDYSTAGEQGPNYYWIEQEGGQRGYINVKGEWLFVDEA